MYTSKNVTKHCEVLNYNNKLNQKYTMSHYENNCMIHTTQYCTKAL